MQPAASVHRHASQTPGTTARREVIRHRPGAVRRGFVCLGAPTQGRKTVRPEWSLLLGKGTCRENREAFTEKPARNSNLAEELEGCFGDQILGQRNFLVSESADRLDNLQQISGI